MNQIEINEDKCIRCQLCVSDCVTSYLSYDGAKIITSGTRCMQCGHCYAICPQGAVTMTNYDFKEQKAVLMSEIDSKTLLSAIKSRRSIRHFKDMKIEDEKILKVLEAGRYSPTGGNAQNVSFTLLKSKLKEAEKICVETFRAAQKIDNPNLEFIKMLNVSDNYFFKGAPEAIVVSSPSYVDAGLASAYMEIMAGSLGLGVLYSGYFVLCSKISEELQNLLDLDEGHEVVTCMVIGYPDVNYQRIVPREALKVKKL